MVMTAVATQGLAMPLKGSDPHDVFQNGQELVHGTSPFARIRRPLAFILKRV